MKTLVLVLAAALLAACAKTSAGTEMGNPPVILRRLISVEEAGADMVEVRGEPGAVSPGGGEVVVRNRSDGGQEVTAAVAEDGSFAVQVPGDVDDEYEIVATGSGGNSDPQTISPAMVSGDGDGDGSDDNTDWQRLHPCQPDEPRDAITVSDVQIEEDTLVLDVSHGGGCERHAYGLCYDEAWPAPESTPPEVRFHVLHDAMGDNCDAFMTAELSFDLTPFKTAYEEAYQTTAGEAAIFFATCGDGAEYCGRTYEWITRQPAPEPKLRLIDEASGEMRVSSEGGLHYMSCTDAVTAVKRGPGEDWVPMLDERPWSTNGAHYVDDVFEPYVYAGEGCDVLQCERLGESTVFPLEYHDTGRTQSPPDAVQGDSAEVPVIETELSPQPWAVRIEYYLRQDCSDEPNTVVLRAN